MASDTTNSIMQSIDAAHQMLVKLTERRNSDPENQRDSRPNPLPHHAAKRLDDVHIDRTA